MGNLFERIKSTVQRLTQMSKIDTDIEPGVPGETPEEVMQPVKRAEYISEASMIHLIRESANHKLLVYMLYNNMWRYVEPYSFRTGKSGILFFGFCLTHNDIHSFYVHRIQELQPTQIPYNPRWIIEF